MRGRVWKIKMKGREWKKEYKRKLMKEEKRKKTEGNNWSMEDGGIEMEEREIRYRKMHKWK
jgi:hypothetical protein